MLSQSIKDALYAIMVSTINILFTIPALAVYDVFAPPVIWIATNIFAMFADAAEPELVEPEQKEVTELERTPRPERVKLDSPRAVKKYYTETIINKDLFFHKTLDVEIPSPRRDSNCRPCTD